MKVTLYKNNLTYMSFSCLGFQDLNINVFSISQTAYKGLEASRKMESPLAS